MFSEAERLILSNQYEILAQLQPNRGATYRQKQEIVERGYEQYYSELGLSEETVPEATTKEVEEILDLFRAIEFSCQRLSYEPKAYGAKFEGFDGNNDHPQYGFAEFLRRTLGKWQELAKYPDNSHSSISLPRYRQMVARWHAAGRPFELTGEQIEQIAGG